MAKYNGSGILLYADGVEIAAQKGFTLNANVNLFDITTKQSLGWSEHDKGVRSVDVSFDCLQSTTGLSNVGLFTYISGRTSLVLAVAGLAKTIVANVDCSNMTINAPTEEATGLSGSFKVNGIVSNLSANLITDPDAGGSNYDTMTISGVSVISAINLAGTAFMYSNNISVLSGDKFKLMVFIIKNSGEVPLAVLWDPTGAERSNIVQLVEGFNFVELTANANDSTTELCLYNSAAANWSTSNIYLLKV